jgi:predicted amidohydrolase
MCQTECIDGDREGNFTRLTSALKKAAARGAAIACFPETCILGWINPVAHRLAHHIPAARSGDDISRLCTLAKRYGLMISVGLAEKNGPLLHDSAVLIDRDGAILLKHRKMNILTSLMSPPYTPGEAIQVAATRYGKVGLLICADTFVKSHLREMRRLQPDLLLVPFGWAAPTDQWPDHGTALAETVTKAAAAVGAPVVGVNAVGTITHGPWCGSTYGGQSVTSDAAGSILAVADDRKEQTVIVQLPLADCP